VRCGAQLLVLVLALAQAAACSDDDEPQWSVVHQGLDSALMSVWAGSSTDVWAVGADSGGSPAVLRFDGEAWTTLDTALAGNLWWVFGFPGGPVFVGGEGGLIAQYDGTELQPMTTPGNGTVFGIWGASPTDVWAVGGSLGGTSGAFAWRLDGNAWVEADGFPADLVNTDAVWKVFGRAADDVWLVGTNGLILHHDGTEFIREDAGVSTALFTVHGSADRIVAVGGFGAGVIIERDASGWRDASPAEARALIGVCDAGGDNAYAVGAEGAVFRRSGGEWVTEPTKTNNLEALHAATMDDTGGVWAVGGQVQATPFVRGVMIHKGDDVPGGLQ